MQKYLLSVRRSSRSLQNWHEAEKKEYLDDLGRGIQADWTSWWRQATSITRSDQLLDGRRGRVPCMDDQGREPRHRRQPARFIRTSRRGFHSSAEVVNYQDLLENGSLAAAAREKGIVGLEGKDYVVKDGDVILFRFNV